jgi:hypothetical protein
MLFIGLEKKQFNFPHKIEISLDDDLKATFTSTKMIVIDFDAISCAPTSDMCTAVHNLGLWAFVCDFDDEQRGFMFSNDPRVELIVSHPLVEKHGHSGASFGICARNVQFIAKYGVDAFNRL